MQPTTEQFPRLPLCLDIMLGVPAIARTKRHTSSHLASCHCRCDRYKNSLLRKKMELIEGTAGVRHHRLCTETSTTRVSIVFFFSILDCLLACTCMSVNVGRYVYFVSSSSHLDYVSLRVSKCSLYERSMAAAIMLN